MVTTIRVPDELFKQLKEEARERGMTLNAYVISIFWNRREVESIFKTEVR